MGHIRSGSSEYVNSFQGSALAAVHWRRYKKDGSLLNEGAEFMIMSKTTGTWKISGVMGQQLQFYGK